MLHAVNLYFVFVTSCNDCVLKKKGGDKLEGEGFVFCICQHCEWQPKCSGEN